MKKKTSGKHSATVTFFHNVFYAKFQLSSAASLNLGQSQNRGLRNRFKENGARMLEKKAFESIASEVANTSNQHFLLFFFRQCFLPCFWEIFN